VRRHPKREQDRTLGERGRVLLRGGQHHALGDLLRHGLIARSREGSCVDERQAVHAAIVPPARRLAHRPEG